MGDIHAQVRPGMTLSEVFFKIWLFLFLDNLILKIIFLIIKINNFQGDLRDILAKTATLMTLVVSLQTSEVFFKIELSAFWILWSYKYIFLIIKTNVFRGGLTDISADKASLLRTLNEFYQMSSVADIAETTLRSPRNIFIFIIKKIIFRIKVSKNKSISNFEKNFTADELCENESLWPHPQVSVAHSNTGTSGCSEWSSGSF